MPHSIEGRAAYNGSRNVAVADLSNDAHAIPEVASPPPPPPSSYHRNLGAQGRTGPTMQRVDLALGTAAPTSSANPAVDCSLPQAAAPRAEATDEAETVATLRRRWPAWLTSLRWPNRLSAVPPRALLRVKRQWVIGAGIALVAALVGWSIGAKPWSSAHKTRPVAAYVHAKGKVPAKLSPSAVRGQNAAKQTSASALNSSKLASTAKGSTAQTRKANTLAGKAQTKTPKTISKPQSKSATPAKQQARPRSVATAQ